MAPLKARMLGEGLAQAVATVRNRPLRALLAALAVAAAVATTAIVQTALDGLAQSAREESARAFGSDAFIISKVAAGNLSRRELEIKFQRNPDLTRSDVRFLEGVADDRVMYAALTQRLSDVTAGGRKFENASISGAQARLFDIRDIPIARGRPFTIDEENAAAPVIVIGADLVNELFPAGDPLGARVRIGNRAFQVVGVQPVQGSGGGAALDRFVWMPLTTFERVFGAPASLDVFAKGPGEIEPVEAEDHARVSMRARRHLEPGAADTFDIITPEAARSFVSAIRERIGAAGPPISLMALLAAIVVVTNTTLVSVTQRTREIGVRRAVGAPRGMILIETIAESSLIAMAGGTAGVVVAVGLLSIGSRSAGIPLDIHWSTIAWSLAAAGFSGIVAGWYPARRAARLDVVTALRQE